MKKPAFMNRKWYRDSYWGGYRAGKKEAIGLMNNPAKLLGNEAHLRTNASFGGLVAGGKAELSGKARVYRSFLHRLGYKDSTLIDYKKGSK